MKTDKNRKKIADIVVATLFVVYIIFAIRTDRLGSFLPNVFSIKVEDISSLMISVFSVQATVATLGIAIISLVSQTVNTKVYGLSASNYLMSYRPTIFKHHVCIVLELTLILLSYICLSLTFFNTLVALFAISISLIILMTFDVLKAYRGDGYLIQCVGEFFEQNLSIESNKKNSKRELLLKTIKDDSVEAIRKDDLLVFSTNMQLLSKVFLDNVQKFTQGKGAEKDDSLKELQNTIASIFQQAYSKGNADIIIKSINITDSIYKKSKAHYPLTLWNISASNYFVALSRLTYTQIMQDSEFMSLKIDLYNNLIEINGDYLGVYSSRIYNSLFRQSFPIWTTQEITKFKNDLYRDTKAIIEIKNYNKEKQGILLTDLLNYTYTLIQSRENEVLQKSFFNDLKSQNRIFTCKEDSQKFYLSILIYLYYLAVCEPLVSEDEKAYVKNLICMHKGDIDAYLEDLGLDMEEKGCLITTEQMDNIVSMLQGWERFPEEHAKFIIMEGTINSFCVYTCVSYTTWSNQLFKKSIQTFAKGNEFSMYSKYFHNEDAYNKYIEYCELFSDSTGAKERYQVFEEFLEKLYVEREILDSQKGRQSPQYYVDLENQLQVEVLDRLNQTIEIFSKNQENDTSKSRKKLLLNLTHANISALDDENMKKQLLDITVTSFVHYFAYILKPYLCTMDLKFKDKNAINNLFKLIEESEATIDTIIGNRRFYSNTERVEAFTEFIDNKHKIRANSTNHLIIALDSSLVHIDIKNITVNICKLSEAEILESVERIEQEDEFLVNITNDIKLPFSAELLMQYYENSKRKMTITMEMAYTILKNKIGAGIFFDYD